MSAAQNPGRARSSRDVPAIDRKSRTPVSRHKSPISEQRPRGRLVRFPTNATTSRGYWQNQRNNMPARQMAREFASRIRVRAKDVNYTDFYPGGSCNNASNATWAPLTLITTLPYIPSSDSAAHIHINESLLAIGENCRSRSIAEIHVLLDTFPGNDEEASAALRRNVALEQARLPQWKGQPSRTGWRAWYPADFDTHLTKIHAHVFGRQPTYSDIFRFASSSLSNRIVGITNADIVLRNPEAIDLDSFSTSLAPFALCISVRPPSGPYAGTCRFTRVGVRDRCVDERGRSRGGGSWDVTIFHSPLVNPRYELLDDLPPTPVYMNQMAGEERAGYFLAESGYRLYNPCKSVIAEHWHCTKHKTHHAKFDLARIVNRTTGSFAYNIRPLHGGMVVARADTPGIICPDRLRQTRTGRWLHLRGKFDQLLFNATLADW